MLRLSDLRLVPPLIGDATCECLVCGLVTARGWTQAPSESFHGWTQVRSNVPSFCEHCWALLKHPRTRRQSWLGRPGEIVFGDLDRIRSWLLEPELPGVAHVTRSHHHQSWISLGRRVSTAPGALWVATDWAGPVLFVGADRSLIHSAEQLLARGVRRTSLLTGRPTPKEWHVAMSEGWADELRRLADLVGRPQWEVAVHVAQS